jgi:hypothetical protein
MREFNDADSIALKYMEGLFKVILNSSPDEAEIKKLITFLNEKDRRRQTNWKKLFPWLEKYDMVQ